MAEYKIVNEYLLSRLGIFMDVDCGLTIIETDRRCCREFSYGFIHMIWIIDLKSGHVVASLPPNSSKDIIEFLYNNIGKRDIVDDTFISQLKILADAEAIRLFKNGINRCFSDMILACDSTTISRPNPNVTTVRLLDKEFGCCSDIDFPDHCLPNGIIYGVINDNKIVSLAYAHKTGEYENIVADIGVVTSKDYRQKGYARACVNSVARHVVNNGGESVYKCSPENIASIHTALSAGYRHIGKSLIFSIIP